MMAVFDIPAAQRRADSSTYAARSLADRPQRDAASLRCAHAKGMPMDGHREQDRGDQMPDREPPAGQDEPDQICRFIPSGPVPMSDVPVNSSRRTAREPTAASRIDRCDAARARWRRDELTGTSDIGTGPLGMTAIWSGSSWPAGGSRSGI